MIDDIYDTIIAYITAHGYPPTVREIGEAVGLKSWYSRAVVTESK